MENVDNNVQTGETRTVNIDGKEYIFDDLKDEAKEAVVQLNEIGQEQQKLQFKFNQMEMARTGYLSVLQDSIGEDVDTVN